jgi:hypothetical protein
VGLLWNGLDLRVWEHGQGGRIGCVRADTGAVKGPGRAGRQPVAEMAPADSARIDAVGPGSPCPAVGLRLGGCQPAPFADLDSYVRLRPVNGLSAVRR